MPIKHNLGTALGVLLACLLSPGLPGRATSQPPTLRASASDVVPTGEAATLYLPVVTNSRYIPRVNVPYFPVANIATDRYDEMAIFWLGRVTPTENYADVRVGYSDTALELVLAIIDRVLWYDTSPSAGDLEAWDAVSVYLDLDQNTRDGPDSNAYRFVAQLSWNGTDRTNWQSAYRGNGTDWAPATIPFTSLGRWRGDAPNNNTEDRGWEARLRIPFASLGLGGPPDQGVLWGLGIAVHDRDDSGAAAIPDQRWPETLNSVQAASWGELRFGQPTYAATPALITHTVIIREGVGDVDVPDVAVGGTIEDLCPGSSNHIWNEWGNRNYGSSRGINIQNQRDIADWPCFAKYYVTFPLDGIPRDRTIISAILTLHHWGNSGVADPGQPNAAHDSFVHVLTVPPTWTEGTLTWNNDPQPMENVSQAWVPVVVDCRSPCIPRNWDVSRAVSQAYVAGGPISFALYSSDSAYHSGKFFTASNVGDWEAVGRPTLAVVWGEP